MSLSWQTLFGRTDRFAIRLGLSTDPKRPTWGTCEVYVGGRCLTACEHGVIGHTTAVEWDVAQVVRFLAANAHAMLAEGDLPELGLPGHSLGAATAAQWLARAVDPLLALTEGELDTWHEHRVAFWRRHSFAAVDGAAFPEVVLRRVLNHVEVSWTASTGTLRPDIRWLEPEGAVRLPVREVAAVVADACRETARQLRHLGLNGGPAPAEVALAPTAPFSLAASGNVARLDAGDRAKLDELVRTARTGARTPPALPVEPEPPDLAEPWVSGYSHAQRYREQAGWGAASPVPDLEGHLSQLGVDVGWIDLACEDLHGLSLCGPDVRTTLRWNRRSPRSGPSWSRQMTLAHELCHLLHDWEPGEELSILSGGAADWAVEARANAFAAELVLPRAGVAQTLAGRRVTRDVLREVMDAFGVGIGAATFHLKNLRVISEDERVALLHGGA